MKCKAVGGVLAIAVMTTACSSGGSSSDPVTLSVSNIPDNYEFESQLVDGESSVSYSGQTARHVLIAKLVDQLEDLEDEPDGGLTLAMGETLVDVLNRYYYVGIESTVKYDDATAAEQLESDNLRAENHNFTAGLSPLTTSVIPGPTYSDISSSHKGLNEKIAGNDSAAHILDPGGFFGWSDGSPATPEVLVQYFFSEIASQADGATFTVPGSGGASVTIDNVRVSPTGRDYRQLVQKFLLGAVSFSQGTADYLGTDWINNNVGPDGGNITTPYTTAEHKWDEAFGYFGANRFYNEYADSVNTAGVVDDLISDGDLDLRSEYNFGNSTNCAKRDLGSAGNSNPTNFSEEVMTAFIEGRAILNRTAKTSGSPMAQSDADAVEDAARTAAVVWEECIAATVIHYINDVIESLSDLSTPITAADITTATYISGFDDQAHFESLAKNWSEMKGFALGLQFSPFSPFRESAANLQTLQDALTAMGDQPVQVGSEDVADYVEALMDVRDDFQAIYGFDAENVAAW